MTQSSVQGRDSFLESTRMMPFLEGDAEVKEDLESGQAVTQEAGERAQVSNMQSPDEAKEGAEGAGGAGGAGGDIITRLLSRSQSSNREGKRPR
jgi:hypothetical protein